MQVPTLTNSIDSIALIPDLNDYYALLRKEVSPAIRSMEKEHRLIWYSFLVHDRETAGRTDLPPEIKASFLHIRFGLPNGADQGDFMQTLPPPFIHPLPKPLGPIGGIDVSRMGGDWATAWWLVGESSDWVLKLVEAHPNHASLSLEQTAQFLHYITNGLLIGGRSLMIPGGFLQF